MHSYPCMLDQKGYACKNHSTIHQLVYLVCFALATCLPSEPRGLMTRALFQDQDLQMHKEILRRNPNNKSLLKWI